MARRTPKYCLHKGTGQAYVTIDGREHYLGKHGSPDSHDAYDRLILEWRQRKDVTGRHSLSVGQLCLAFIDHADGYYRRPDGTPTGETQNFRDALRPLCQMLRTLPVAEFGPLKLKKVRDQIVSHGIVRPSVNKRIARIKQVFKNLSENLIALEKGVNLPEDGVSTDSFPKEGSRCLSSGVLTNIACPMSFGIACKR